jgi:hypothetical protein
VEEGRAREAVSTACLLHLYVVCLGAALLVTPAFLNYGPFALHAIVVCVAPLLLPTVALHLLVAFLDGMCLGPFCGLAALTEGVLLAVLSTHGVDVERSRWGVHLGAFLLAAAFALSLRERARLAGALAAVLLVPPVAVLEAGAWGDAAGVATGAVFAGQVVCLAGFAVAAAAQYRSLALALAPARHGHVAAAGGA